MVGDGAVAVVEGSIEARHLQQVGMAVQQRADRGQVIGLMQRCERNVLLELREHRLVDDDRPVICRPTVNHAVTNREQVQPLGLAKPGGHGGHRRGNVGDLVRCVGFLDERGLIAPACRKVRPGADALELTFDQKSQLEGLLDGENLELDARRAGVDDEDRIHRDQAFGNGAARRRASA
jgi:hypothetical protein